MQSDVATKLRVFTASSNPSTSSNGFVNYDFATPKGLRRALDAVFAEWPDALVVDGDENWSGREQNRPEVFARKAGIAPLALFHTGISGVTHTGIVVTDVDFERLAEDYQARYGEPLKGHKPDRKAWHVRPKIYTQDNYDGYDPEDV